MRLSIVRVDSDQERTIDMILKLCLFVWVCSVTTGFFSSLGLIAYFIITKADR